jgi:hypothetical protein
MLEFLHNKKIIMDQRVHRILCSTASEQGTDEWFSWRRSKLTASDFNDHRQCSQESPAPDR